MRNHISLIYITDQKQINMKKQLLTCLTAAGISLTANAQQLVFPGAEGFGAYAKGGRGGTVVHVTNLNASGAGSLADAVSKPNRIVVFDVGGVIDITGAFITVSSNTYIAQTVAQNQQMNQVGQAIAVQTINQVNANGGRATNVSGSSSGNMGSYSSSGGGSSSSSSRVCRKLSATDLAHCNGNGKCPKCNGSKKYFDISYGVSKWVDPCVTCNGSGKCPSCHGTGSRF